MAGEPADSAADLLQAARALAPRIAAAADEIERQRRLPESLVQALTDVGLFHMLLPASLGGAEADPATFALVMEEIARADASTAWCLGQGAGATMFAARLAPETAAQIWGDRRGIVAVGQGAGSAVERPDGYRLSGRWRFASGARHATWMGARNVRLLHTDGSSITGPNGLPEERVFMFPAEQAQFTDVWQVNGLRGTGSDDYAVDDVFVPAGFVLSPSLHQQPAAARALYCISETTLFGIGFAGVALGVAVASLDAFTELAQSKKPTLGSSLLRDDPVVQNRFGRTVASWHAAHAFLHTAIAGAWRSACREQKLSMDEQVRLRLAITHAMHEASDIVATVYRAAGATAIFDGGPLERRLRDINAITQQVQAAEQHFQTAGRYLLSVAHETHR